MRVNFRAFNGLVGALLVRNGADEMIPGGAHTFAPVYTEMMLQIATDYPGLPDCRELTARQILFFYNGIRGGLKEHTKPK